jgi:hypothetical protein
MRRDAAFMALELNAVRLVGRDRARPREPDSGDTGIISITVRVRRTSWNAMEPRIQRVLTQ